MQASIYNTTANPVHITANYKLGDWYRKFNGIEALTYILRKSRPWFSREMNKYGLHPIIDRVLNNPEHNQYLNDWREMVLEYPHVAESDSTKVAYTQNEDKGVRDIQTVTSLGKFLRRHAPTMPDHLLRDIVALAALDKCEFIHDLDAMLDVMDNTLASSCMTGACGSDVHPYSVYHPQYGWHMAVRHDVNGVVGRALCLTTEDGLKVFVRTYKYGGEGRGTCTDEMMQAWLKSQGYEHVSEWPEGTKLDRITENGDLVAPYIDGDNHYVDDHGTYLRLVHRGQYECRNTSGYADDDSRLHCSDCGDRGHEEDGIYIGYYQHDWVCNCCSDTYVSVFGRGGDQYYAHQDAAVYCESDDNYYHDDYLDRYDIVYVDDEGAYYHQDDCVNLESGEWAHAGNCNVVELGDGSGEYAWDSDCWQCHITGLWFLCSTSLRYYAGEFKLDSAVTPDGDDVHPDYYTPLPDDYFTGEVKHHFVSLF